MHLLENGHLNGLGREAALFLPEPDASIDPGQPEQTATADSPACRRKTLGDTVRDAVEDAKQNPDSARQLFNLLVWHVGLLVLYRCDDDELIQRVRTNFEKLGISLEFLSQ